MPLKEQDKADELKNHLVKTKLRDIS
jgi:hypothetical protein